MKHLRKKIKMIWRVMRQYKEDNWFVILANLKNPKLSLHQESSLMLDSVHWLDLQTSWKMYENLKEYIEKNPDCWLSDLSQKDTNALLWTWDLIEEDAEQIWEDNKETVWGEMNANKEL